MRASDIPAVFPKAFAQNADGSYVRTIPAASQISIQPGAASLNDGFPPANFLPIEGGGVPFFGSDLNGILRQITTNLQWAQAGGMAAYNSALSAAVGGYSNGAILQRTDGTGFWRSTADNNTSNPEASGPNWVPQFFSVSPDDLISPINYGADPTGVTDSKAAFEACFAANKIVFIKPGTYRLSDAATLAMTGDGFKVYCFEGVEIVSSSPASAAKGFFNFLGTGDGFRFCANEAVFRHATMPTVRSDGHAIYVRGTTITNLDIGGLDIQSSGNMGLAIYCGDDGGTAAGSRNFRIHDCKFLNTLGDGWHVENLDANLHVSNINGKNNGDDAGAVINYTGTGGAPRHPTQTVGVLIVNISAEDAHTSSLSLLGVANCVVSSVREKAASGASVFTIKCSSADPDYAVGNSNWVVDGVFSDGATKVIVADAPTGGTAQQQNMRFTNINAINIGNQAFSFSSSAPATSNSIQDIYLSGSFRGTGLSGSQVGYVGMTRNTRLDIRADSFGAGPLLANNIDLSWDLIKMQAFGSGTTFAMAFFGNVNTRAGRVDIDAGNCTTGVQCQSNAGLLHDGLWRVVNATTQYVFGSNTGVIGRFDVIRGRQAVGAVAAGTLLVTYARPAPAGAGVYLRTDIQSDTAIAIAHKNASNTDVTMVWGGSSANVIVDYEVEVYAA